jgi:putative membrane protein insertion efficiency factor
VDEFKSASLRVGKTPVCLRSQQEDCADGGSAKPVPPVAERGISPKTGRFSVGNRLYRGGRKNPGELLVRKNRTGIDSIIKIMVVKGILALIRFYQLVRAQLPIPSSCRFYPSCSVYGAEAVSRHGAARGVQLTIARIFRCNPWNKGGFDAIPE